MKTLALTPWPINPPTTGGTQRCYNLLKNIDDLTVMSLDWDGEKEYKRHEGTTTYHVIPADPEAKEQARKLFQSAHLRSYDTIPSLTRNNLTTIRKAIDDYDPDLIILEHPWLVDLTDGRPYIYDAHNCESKATGQLFGTQTYDYELVKAIEQRCIREAEHIIYCSEDDLTLMDKIQHITCPTTFIPNGTDIPTLTEARQNQESKELIFVGSMYLPNAIAAQHLVALAPQFPDYTFTIIGGCCDAVVSDQPNVQLLGHISEQELNTKLNTAHAFINLTTRGAGTQLKIAQALSYGLPVISTPIGARGYVTPLLVTANTIGEALQELQLNYEAHSYNARLEAESLDWIILGKKYKDTINALQ
jgi:glycosyltransferase involved in cell wall biosynthesis